MNTIAWLSLAARLGLGLSARARRDYLAHVRAAGLVPPPGPPPRATLPAALDHFQRHRDALDPDPALRALHERALAGDLPMHPGDPDTAVYLAAYRAAVGDDDVWSSVSPADDAVGERVAGALLGLLGATLEALADAEPTERELLEAFRAALARRAR